MAHALTTVSYCADKARQWRMHVSGTFYGREGDIVYNTALLFGREGELVGVHRKNEVRVLSLSLSLSLSLFLSLSLRACVRACVCVCHTFPSTRTTHVLKHN